MNQKFDLIVIGAGSGLDVANAAAGNGLKVAIMEKDRMGGTCLNRGCIPSKMLLHYADIVETIKQSKDFGIKVDGYSFDFASITSEVSAFVDKESGGIEKAFTGISNPRLIKGEARFVGPKLLKVGDDTYEADKILIANGGKPRIPKIPGLVEAGFLTSDQVLRLPTLPETLTIIGGGYVAAEMAHFLGSMGTKVTILEIGNKMISKEDEEISSAFTSIFSTKHTVVLNARPYAVKKSGGKYQVDLTVDGKYMRVESDQLMVAAGRVPNTDSLKPENTRVRLDDQGFVIVNEYLETNVEGICAIGDAVGNYLFKHSANLEAQFSFYNIIDPASKVPVNYTAIPHAIFTSPQVAAVGLTEKQAKESSFDYVIGKYSYIDTGMGRAIKDNDGFVKLIVEKGSRRILGCHILGHDASTLIHEVVVAMNSGEGKLGNITNSVHAHPALSEVILKAGLECRKQL